MKIFRPLEFGRNTAAQTLKNVGLTEDDGKIKQELLPESSGENSDIKVYRSLLSQIGTSNPTAINLENALGNVTLTRLGQGVYKLTASGVTFTHSNFVAEAEVADTQFKVVFRFGFEDGSIHILTLFNSCLTDSCLTRTPIVLTVYPEAQAVPAPRASWQPAHQVTDWSTENWWDGTYHSDVTMSELQAVDPLTVKTIEFHRPWSQAGVPFTEDSVHLRGIFNLSAYTNLHTFQIGRYSTVMVNSLKLNRFPPSIFYIELWDQTDVRPDGKLDLHYLLGNAPNLEKLHLFHLGITELPGLIQLLPALIELYLAGNNFSTAGINEILIALDQNGRTNGYAHVVSQTDGSAPSGAGVTARNNLVSKGWSIFTH